MESFIRDVFKGVGVPAADAAVCADVLITADKLGIELEPCTFKDRAHNGKEDPKLCSLVKEKLADLRQS